MQEQERILKRIEAAGWCVTGFRDAIGDGADRPLQLTAIKNDTGGQHTATAVERGSDGEIIALRRLAEKAGVPLNDGLTATDADQPAAR
jgi:hypothetical protein